MVQNTVIMRFKDEIGKTQSITVRDVEDNVSDTKIKTIMNSIVNTGAIVGAGGAYVQLLDAEKVVKDTTKVSL